MRQLKRDVSRLAAEVHAKAGNDFAVIVVDLIDPSHPKGPHIAPSGYQTELRLGMACARLWLPAAEAVEIVEAMREVWAGSFPSACVLMAVEAPQARFWRVPVRGHDEAMPDYASRVLATLPLDL